MASLMISSVLYHGVPLSSYLILSAILFTIGVVGFLLRRNIIVIFMSIELMLNAANLAFIALAKEHGFADAQVVVLFVITVAAAEAAVGLAIVILLFRNRQTLIVDEASILKL
jgi:NADH-quinone oxidoreductase subunit K